MGAADLARVVRTAGIQDLSLAAVACKALHNALLDAQLGSANRLLGADVAARLYATLDELADAARDAANAAAALDAAERDPGNTDFLAAAKALLAILDEAA